MFSSERENEPTETQEVVWHKRELREPTEKELLDTWENLGGKVHNSLLCFALEERLQIIKEVIVSYDLGTKGVSMDIVEISLGAIIISGTIVFIIFMFFNLAMLILEDLRI